MIDFPFSKELSEKGNYVLSFYDETKAINDSRTLSVSMKREKSVGILDSKNSLQSVKKRVATLVFHFVEKVP